MNSLTYLLPKSTGWIFSAKKDLLLFVLPIFIGIILVYFFAYINLDPENIIKIGGTIVYARISWIDWLFIALLDAPHVFSTGYRVFTDSKETQRRRSLFIYLPVLVFIFLFAAFSISELWTFRAFSYLNIYHLIKQQYGWVRYSDYRSNIKEKINKTILKMSIYNLTLIPILLWHFNPSMQNQTGWIFDGDLFLYPSKYIYSALTSIHWALNLVLMLSLFSHVVLKKRAVPMGQLIVLFSTWLAWYGGIVLKIGGNETFLLDILHVIPYLGLTYFVYKDQLTQLFKINFITFYTPLAVLGLCLTAIYSIYTTAIQNLSTTLVLSFLVGISVTHYILDGYIWKINKDNLVAERWLLR